MSSLAAEGKLGFKSVCYTAYNKYLLAARRVLLTIQDVVYHGVWKLRRKRRPLFRGKYAAHCREVVVGIWTGKLKRVVDAVDLECRVGNKLAVELQERGVLALCQRLVYDTCHHPLPLNTVEHILTHLMTPKIDALYHHMAYRCILYNIHLLHVVEYQRVEILAHEEVVHSPTLLLYQHRVAPEYEWT